MERQHKTIKINPPSNIIFRRFGGEEKRKLGLPTNHARRDQFNSRASNEWWYFPWPASHKQFTCSFSTVPHNPVIQIVSSKWQVHRECRQSVIKRKANCQSCNTTIASCQCWFLSSPTGQQQMHMVNKEQRGKECCLWYQFFYLKYE